MRQPTPGKAAKPRILSAPPGECAYCDDRRAYFAEQMRLRRIQLKKAGRKRRSRVPPGSAK